MNNDEIKVKLSYGVDYYKGDKGDKPVKGVDYFTEQDINEIIETIQAGEYDLTSYATKDYVDDAVAGMIVEETDPTVPEWAKQATKPSYNANEVGALPADTQLFSGNYEDLTNKPTLFSGDYEDLSNKPTIPTVPSNVSAFTNDAGYLTEHQSLSNYATKAYVDSAIEGIDIPEGGITVETDPTVPSWAKQASKPTYTAQEVGALPANTELFSGDYEDLTNKPTIPPAPIVIQVGIAGQPSVVDGVYTLPLTITSNNLAEAYAQYQTHPSTVGMSVDLSAMGTPTKMYLDCESFYRYGNDSSGYTYETFGEFNDNSLSQSFGYEFMNVNVHLNTGGSGSRGTVVGVATVHQLASKANSADLATVATSGDYNDLTNKPTLFSGDYDDLSNKPTLFSGNYNDLTNKPTIPVVPSNVSAFNNDAGYVNSSAVNTAISNATINADQVIIGEEKNEETGEMVNVYLNNNNYATTDDIDNLSNYVDGELAKIDPSLSNADVEAGRVLISEEYDSENEETIRTYLSDLLANNGIGFTTAYGDGNIKKESNLDIDGLNIYSYGEADPETGDQEIKSILITGEGITFDDTHTLGVSNGELVFDDSPIGSGGGSSYTAGDGISIDSNGVISRDNGTYPLFGLLLNLFTDMMTAPYNQQASIRNLNLSVIGGNETVAGHIQNLKSYGMTIINKQTTANEWLQILSALDPAITSVSTQFKEFGCWSSVPSQYTLSGGNGTRSPTELASATNGLNTILVMFDNKQSADSYFRWRFIQNPHILFQNHYFNSLQGLTSHSVAGAIDEVATNLNTRIPSAPSTNGNYVLQATVADGAVVYDWVEVSVGGSY